MPNIIDLFPIAPRAPYTMYARYSGLSEIDGRRIVFTSPSEQTKSAVVDVLRAIVAFEQDRSQANVRKFERKLIRANMGGFRFNDKPGIFLLYPKNVEEVGANIFWRLGAMQVPGVPATYDNQLHPLGISQEHARRDITMAKALQLFLLTRSKFLVTNATAANISGKPSDCPQQASRSLSDPSHSMGTIFSPIMWYLLQEAFPLLALIQPHTASNIKKLLMVNNRNNQFLKDGTRSFNTLFALSLLADPTRVQNSLVVASTLPGFVVVNGAKYKLTNQVDNTGFFSYNASPHSNNVIGHIANRGGCAFGPVQLDRAVHCEWGTDFYGNVDGKFDYFVESTNRAMPWYVQYDPLTQNPWTLDATRPGVYNDMSKFGKLFKSANPIGSANPNSSREYSTFAARKTATSQPMLFRSVTSGKISTLPMNSSLTSSTRLLRRILRA